MKDIQIIWNTNISFPENQSIIVVKFKKEYDTRDLSYAIASVFANNIFIDGEMCDFNEIEKWVYIA